MTDGASLYFVHYVSYIYDANTGIWYQYYDDKITGIGGFG